MQPSAETYISYDVTLRVSADGEIALTETWEREGQLSRLNGPALIERSGFTGQAVLEAWCKDGIEHRAGGPAIIEYHDDGDATVALQAWKWEGKFHRRNGPAVREWGPDGVLLREEWWVDGQKLT